MLTCLSLKMGPAIDHIESYEIHKSIGEGTFGKVKLGYHKATREKVAIKVLEKARIVDEADIQRVIRELQILKMIRHPHIIQLYEIIETDTEIFLIMEFASGGELFDYIVKKGRVNEYESCKFFHQIISGVDKTHSLHVVHRDLKPENLLLDSSNNIKIVDFGLSNRYEPGGQLKTACGSPCYAAPEMIAGKHYNPLDCDLWSCGVILFAMTCGFLPFEDADTSKLYKKILSGQFSIPDHISTNLRNLINGLLTTDPSKRLNLEQIRVHPWFLHPQVIKAGGSLSGGSFCWVHSCRSCTDWEAAGGFEGVTKNPNEFILNEVEQITNVSRSEITRQLIGNCHTPATATYYLILDRRRRHAEHTALSGKSTNLRTVSTNNSSGSHGQSSQQSTNGHGTSNLSGGHRRIPPINIASPSVNQNGVVANVHANSVSSALTARGNDDAVLVSVKNNVATSIATPRVGNHAVVRTAPRSLMDVGSASARVPSGSFNPNSAAAIAAQLKAQHAASRSIAATAATNNSQAKPAKAPTVQTTARRAVVDPSSQQQELPNASSAVGSCMPLQIPSQQVSLPVRRIATSSATSANPAPLHPSYSPPPTARGVSANSAIMQQQVIVSGSHSNSSSITSNNIHANNYAILNPVTSFTPPQQHQNATPPLANYPSTQNVEELRSENTYGQSSAPLHQNQNNKTNNNYSETFSHAPPLSARQAERLSTTAKMADVEPCSLPPRRVLSSSANGSHNVTIVTTSRQQQNASNNEYTSTMLLNSNNTGDNQHRNPGILTARKTTGAANFLSSSPATSRPTAPSSAQKQEQTSLHNISQKPNASIASKGHQNQNSISQQNYSSSSTSHNSHPRHQPSHYSAAAVERGSTSNRGPMLMTSVVGTLHQHNNNSSNNSSMIGNVRATPPQSGRLPNSLSLSSPPALAMSNGKQSSGQVYVSARNGSGSNQITHHAHAHASHQSAVQPNTGRRASADEGVLFDINSRGNSDILGYPRDMALAAQQMASNINSTGTRLQPNTIVNSASPMKFVFGQESNPRSSSGLTVYSKTNSSHNNQNQQQQQQQPYSARLSSHLHSPMMHGGLTLRPPPASGNNNLMRTAARRTQQEILTARVHSSATNTGPSQSVPQPMQTPRSQLGFSSTVVVNKSAMMSFSSNNVSSSGFPQTSGSSGGGASLVPNSARGSTPRGPHATGGMSMSRDGVPVRRWK